MSGPDPRRQTRFHRSPRLTLGLVLGALLTLLGGIDHLLARRDAARQPGVFSREYHHDLKKRFRGFARVGVNFPVLVVTNSLGFRDATEREIAPASAKRRLVLLGDSFTFGVGIRYEETFAGRVVARLDSPQLEVLNAGVASYSPKLHLYKMKYLLETLRLRVDDLIVFIDASDPQDEVLYETFEPGEVALSDQLGVRSFTYRRLSGMYLRWRAGGAPGNYLAPNAEMQAARPVWYQPRAFASWGERGAKLAELHLEQLRALCAAHGVKLHLAVYPWPVHLAEGTPDSPLVARWRAFAQGRGIGFLDLSPLFFSLPTEEAVQRLYLPRNYHWNAEGHRVVADAVIDYYQASLLGPSP